MIIEFRFNSFSIFREIDSAFLRRFEKKLLIDLPSAEERLYLLKQFAPKWTNEQFRALSNATEGLTGAEIKIAIKEAKMKKIRNIIATGDRMDDDVDFNHLIDALAVTSPSMKSQTAKHVTWHKLNGKKGDQCED